MGWLLTIGQIYSDLFRFKKKKKDKANNYLVNLIGFVGGKILGLSYIDQRGIL